MDIYERTWLGFVFPAYIIFLVVMIIIISTYSQRFSRLLSRKNPVATLATLVLLSYASVLRNVIALLSFATIKYSDDSSRFVWLVDANVPYLKGKHVIIFIAAFLVIFNWSFIYSTSTYLAVVATMSKETNLKVDHKHKTIFIHGYIPCSLQSEISLLDRVAIACSCSAVFSFGPKRCQCPKHWPLSCGVYMLWSFSTERYTR